MLVVVKIRCLAQYFFFGPVIFLAQYFFDPVFFYLLQPLSSLFGLILATLGLAQKEKREVARGIKTLSQKKPEPKQ
jgi:hypothetical protein